MRVGIPSEIWPGERRVACTPANVEKLIEFGFEVSVQKGAGVDAAFPDALYEAAGATLVDDAVELWSSADLILKVRGPSDNEVKLTHEGQTLISFLWPAQNEPLLKKLAERKVTALAMDMVPRISRAQKMDALSSMANIAGYRAVIEAASEYGSFFTGQITAAGKVPPATVLVIGAGVAGLSALGAAKSLGARVRAFDTRPSVKEQVESLGGTFLELEFEEDGEGQGGYAKVMSKEFIDAEMALFREQAAEVDIVITTALIPGKKAPILWTADMVEKMKPGSVVVDLAAEQGGNCELTKPGEKAFEHDVHIVGYTDMTSRLATTASQLYGTNLLHLLDDMGKAEGFAVDFDDEVVRGATVVKAGEITWPPPVVEPKPKPKPKVEDKPIAPKVAAPTPAKQSAPKKGSPLAIAASIGLAALWLGLRFAADDAVSPSTVHFLQHLTVFVLAVFVGWQVVWSVTAALHTPLMSVTNAISGIIIVGGLLQVRGDGLSAAAVLGVLAVLLATINIAGGFLVTQRMLKMFRK